MSILHRESLVLVLTLCSITSCLSNKDISSDNPYSPEINKAPRDQPYQSRVLREELSKNAMQIWVINRSEETCMPLSREYARQYYSIPKKIRKKVIDAYLKSYALLSVNGEEFGKYYDMVFDLVEYKKQVAYYAELQKKGYLPTHCHPNWWIGDDRKKFEPYIAYEAYQIIRNNPSYLKGKGIIGLSRMLTYGQYHTCHEYCIQFSPKILEEIGIYSMKARPLSKDKDYPKWAIELYEKEIYRVYYTESDNIVSHSKTDAGKDARDIFKELKKSSILGALGAIE